MDFHGFPWKFHQKCTWNRGPQTPFLRPIHRAANLKFFHGSRDTNEKQSPFFFDFRIRFHAPRMRQNPIFQCDDINLRKFQSLGCVHCHQSHFVRTGFPSVHITHQTSLIQIDIDPSQYAILQNKFMCRIQQFVEVGCPFFVFRNTTGKQDIPVSRFPVDMSNHCRHQFGCFAAESHH